MPQDTGLAPAFQLALSIIALGMKTLSRLSSNELLPSPPDYVLLFVALLPLFLVTTIMKVVIGSLVLFYIQHKYVGIINGWR